MIRAVYLRRLRVAPRYPFVKGEEIQYGNENVIPYSAPGGDFDSVELSVGDVINIPVAEINIDGSPSGGLSRFLSWLSH